MRMNGSAVPSLKVHDPKSIGLHILLLKQVRLVITTPLHAGQDLRCKTKIEHAQLSLRRGCDFYEESACVDHVSKN